MPPRLLSVGRGGCAGRGAGDGDADAGPRANRCGGGGGAGRRGWVVLPGCTSFEKVFGVEPADLLEMVLKARNHPGGEDGASVLLSFPSRTSILSWSKSRSLTRMRRHSERRRPEP